MFLNLVKPAESSDRGSTMLAVLGLTAVTAVVSLTVVASTVNGLGFTSSTRAGVQARAAAEAGIDQAVADIQGSCVSTFASTTDPIFTYDLAYSILSTTPTWVAGCPTNAATLVRVRSTGSAANPGVAGADAGDERTVEAIYANVPLFVEVPQVDPAVYAHTMEGVFKNFVLNSSTDDISADVHIKNGNVVCENGATIDGDVVLANGYVDLNRCDVLGTIHASQYVDITGTGTVVTGDVIAMGEALLSGNAVRLISGIGEVRGNVYSSGNVRIGDLVKGNVGLSGTSANSVTIDSSGRVEGNVVSSGAATVNGTVNGTVSTNFSGLNALTAPRVPEWTDVPYPSSAWDGYTVVPWSGNCSIGNTHAFWTSLATLTSVSGNLVVDARSCGAAGLDFQNNIRDLTMNANISFIAWKFNIDKLTVKSNTPTATRYLWFMVPDYTADEQPTCPSPVVAATPAGTITLTNEADIQSTIAVMAYTPCKIISDRNNWRGQLYGGTMQFLQQAQLTYVPVGVPGVDFDSSLPPILDNNDSKLGSRVSIRELAQ